MHKKYFFLSSIMMITSTGFLYSMNNQTKGCPPGTGPNFQRAVLNAAVKGGRNAAFCTAIVTIPSFFMNRNSSITEKVMIPTASTAISAFGGAFFGEKTAKKNPYLPLITITRRGAQAGTVTGTIVGMGVLSLVYLKSLYLETNNKDFK